MSKRIFIFNTGPTLSTDVIDTLEGEHCIAVNNSYELAPWADALVATDKAWWDKNPDALLFEGRKISSCFDPPAGVETVRNGIANHRACSGVLAMEVAKQMGAQQIILLGTDFHGTHYFGRYSNGLQNTSEHRRAIHHRQFHVWWLINRAKINVVNCSPGTRLRHIPTARLEDII